MLAREIRSRSYCTLAPRYVFRAGWRGEVKLPLPHSSHRIDLPGQTSGMSIACMTVPLVRLMRTGRPTGIVQLVQELRHADPGDR